MKTNTANTKLLTLTKPGRPGALTEQINLRISKATAKRLEAFRRAHGIETRADALRVALREVGL